MEVFAIPLRKTQYDDRDEVGDVVLIKGEVTNYKVTKVTHRTTNSVFICNHSNFTAIYEINKQIQEHKPQKNKCKCKRKTDHKDQQQLLLRCEQWIS